VKLSYINEIAGLCERTGADIGEVTHVLGHDLRIGASHLQPGLSHERPRQVQSHSRGISYAFPDAVG
jgi:hypothetical protein